MVCIERMETFHSEGKYKFYDKILDEIKKHPNQEYYIYKSIILNNLYGVDIMNEAVETAKLRLFLKLMATVDVDYTKPNLGLEPLPDIDFNIRAGNTLVGFTSIAEVERAVEGHMNFELLRKEIDGIKEEAELVDKAYKRFRTSHMDNDLTLPDAKRDLQERLNNLNDKLNTYQAELYKIDVIGKPDDFIKWKDSHKPFHWFVEFYGIVNDKGGFDVIIGNPPYVEYSKVKKDYNILNYETEKCGNLYAFVIERSIALLSVAGYFGMIVPLSSVSTPRMIPIINLYKSEKVKSWFSFYAGDSNLSTLFNGVKSQLSIHIINRHIFTIFTTNYIRWFDQARSSLMESIKYIESTETYNNNCLTKVGHEIELNILSKLKVQKKTILNYFQNNESKKFYYRNASGSYYRFFTIKPPFISINGRKQISTTLKQQIVSFDPKIAVSLLSSTLFHWFWTCYSDNYHITNKEFSGFFINNDLMIKSNATELLGLCNNLMKDYQINSRIRFEIDNRNKVEREVQIFEPRKSKHIIDKIDRVLAQHYGFTDEELDFIINYDIKYRMGKGLEAEDEN